MNCHVTDWVNPDQKEEHIFKYTNSPSIYEVNVYPGIILIRK